MRTPRSLMVSMVSLVLVAACSSTTATPSSAPQTETPATTAPQSEMPASQAPSEPEAWTQSDIFQGFDPMCVDLTGSTPGPNGEHSTPAADIADPTADCLQQIKDQHLKLAFLTTCWPELDVGHRGRRERERRPSTASTWL